MVEFAGLPGSIAQGVKNAGPYIAPLVLRLRIMRGADPVAQQTLQQGCRRMAGGCSSPIFPCAEILDIRESQAQDFERARLLTIEFHGAAHCCLHCERGLVGRHRHGLQGERRAAIVEAALEDVYPPV